MKRGDTWDDITFAFRQKKSTLEKSLYNVIGVIVHVFHKALVRDSLGERSVELLMDNYMQFKLFPFHFYAVDIRFHQALPLVGLQDDSKPYSSSKYKLYGYKSEVPFFFNGSCICSSSHRMNAVSDTSIILKVKTRQKLVLQKHDDDCEEIHDFWGFMGNNCNQIIQQKF